MGPPRAWKGGPIVVKAIIEGRQVPKGEGPAWRSNVLTGQGLHWLAFSLAARTWRLKSAMTPPICSLIAFTSSR